MNDDVNAVVAAKCLLHLFADEPLRIRLINGGLHHIDPSVVLTTDVNEGCLDTHGVASDQNAFDQLVRIVLKDLSVFE